MIFSCLVDADFRDTEGFYADAKGEAVDRDWPTLPEIVIRYAVGSMITSQDLIAKGRSITYAARF